MHSNNKNKIRNLSSEKYEIFKNNNNNNNNNNKNNNNNIFYNNNFPHNTNINQTRPKKANNLIKSKVIEGEMESSSNKKSSINKNNFPENKFYNKINNNKQKNFSNKNHLPRKSPIPLTRSIQNNPKYVNIKKPSYNYCNNFYLFNPSYKYNYNNREYMLTSLFILDEGIAPQYYYSTGRILGYMRMLGYEYS